jgi:uncharacterized protein
MTQGEILKVVEKKVKQMMTKVKMTAHDFKHVDRVRKAALKIAKKEKYNLFLAELAALLHDAGRARGEDHAKFSALFSEKFLKKFKEIKPKERKEIIRAIKIHSDPYVQGKLAQILQDADKLDALGAIGIARCFGSRSDLKDYDSKKLFLAPKLYKDRVLKKWFIHKKDIKTDFDNLLMQLRFYKMLYTHEAKRLAKKRYQYMKEFVNEYRKEIENKV